MTITMAMAITMTMMDRVAPADLPGNSVVDGLANRVGHSVTHEVSNLPLMVDSPRGALVVNTLVNALAFLGDNLATILVVSGVNDSLKLVMALLMMHVVTMLLHVVVVHNVAPDFVVGRGR